MDRPFPQRYRAFVRVRARHGENPRLLLERHWLDLDRHQLGRDARKPASGRRRPRNNTGKQPTFRVANTDNPNLTQFAKDELKKSNDEVHRGKAMYARESRCWATGVPTYLLNPAQPTFFLQAPDKVTMIWQMDHQVRRVYLNVPHSENPKPSWYGESVGHYEGDTFVIDTIGQHTKTFVDNYRTPHSEKLHVVERYRLVDEGRILQAEVTIEDPDVFIKPLQVLHRWRRVQGPMRESSCAEGEMTNPFKQDVEPLPMAELADF
jgi:hypothetical protein